MCDNVSPGRPSCQWMVPWLQLPSSSSCLSASDQQSAFLCSHHHSHPGRRPPLGIADWSRKSLQSRDHSIKQSLIAKTIFTEWHQQHVLMRVPQLYRWVTVTANRWEREGWRRWHVTGERETGDRWQVTQTSVVDAASSVDIFLPHALLHWHLPASFGLFGFLAQLIRA